MGHQCFNGRLDPPTWTNLFYTRPLRGSSFPSTGGPRLRSYKPNPGRSAIFVEIFTQTEAMRRHVARGRPYEGEAHIRGTLLRFPSGGTRLVGFSLNLG